MICNLELYSRCLWQILFPAKSFVLSMHRKSYYTDFMFILIDAQHHLKDMATRQKATYL